MKQTQETKKLYQKVQCVLVRFVSTNVLTESIELTADEIVFEEAWLE